MVDVARAVHARIADVIVSQEYGALWGKTRDHILHRNLLRGVPISVELELPHPGVVIALQKLSGDSGCRWVGVIWELSRLIQAGDPNDIVTVDVAPDRILILAVNVLIEVVGVRKV